MNLTNRPVLEVAIVTSFFLQYNVAKLEKTQLPIKITLLSCFLWKNTLDFLVFFIKVHLVKTFKAFCFTYTFSNQKITEFFPVLAGDDLGYHLIGNQNFCTNIIRVFVEVTGEFDSSD